MCLSLPKREFFYYQFPTFFSFLFLEKEWGSSISVFLSRLVHSNVYKINKILLLAKAVSNMRTFYVFSDADSALFAGFGSDPAFNRVITINSHAHKKSNIFITFFE